MNIYYFDIREHNKSIEKDLFRLISSNRKQKIKNFRFYNDKIWSLYGEVLLRYGLFLSNYYMLNQEISYTEYGKPYLKENYGIHFNISHSGDYVICAISNNPVGIDIQQHSFIDLEIIDLLHEVEKERLLCANLDEELKKFLFFNIWVGKESFIKYSGTGLSCDLNSFYINEFTNNVIIEGKDIIISPSIAYLTMKPDYSVAVCSDEVKIDSILNVSNNDMKCLFFW